MPGRYLGPRAAVVPEAQNLMHGLRIVREERGLSQAQLGGQIGVPGQLVGEWERGEVMPTITSLARWAKALDLRLAVVPIDTD
jgi:transcriptional regulator with XRE-family HTH domain